MEVIHLTGTLSLICDVIILVAAVLGAIATILKYFNAPIKFIQRKQDTAFEAKVKECLKKILPEMLELDQISSIVLKEVMPILKEIKDINTKQNATIEVLAKSSRDVLREKIMEIYYRGKDSKAMVLHDKEKLDQYYKDYKAEGGNSYIDKYYNRMKEWTIIDE